MREEVMVLPQPAERGKSGFCPSKTELNVGRKWIAPDGIFAKRSSQAIGISSDLRSEMVGAGASEFVSAQTVQTDILRGGDCGTDLPSELQKYEKGSGKGWGKKGTQDLAFWSVYQPPKELSQGASLFHWGSLKKGRCRRVPKHYPSPSNVVNETNAVQVQDAKDPTFITVRSAAARSKPTNTVASESDHPCSPLATAVECTEEECKREKCPKRSSDSREGQREASIQRCKRASLHTSQQAPQQEGLPHQSITSSSPEKSLSSPERHTAAVSDGIEAGLTRKDLAWPKIVIPLSRKEKADDFLMFKSSKLSLRPKRRPRAVEKALLYCTPGNWLSDVSLSRYNVKEKKCLKGQPRGLKAMESMDTDSE